MNHILSRQRDISRAITRAFAIGQHYEDGDPIEKIAATFGVSRGTVSRIARKLGLSKRYEEVKKARNEEIVGGYKNGVAIRELAERYAISEADVCLIARKAGLRRYNRWLDQIDEIVAYRTKHTQRETIAKFGFSRSTLIRIRDEAERRKRK